VYNARDGVNRTDGLGVQRPTMKGIANMARARPRLGISACLLGQPTRYDGGDKLDAFLRDTLGRQFELVPICPEVEAGLGVPREPMRLEGEAQRPRLVTRQTRRDLTETMETWARRRVVELEKEHLAGFIFKARSPSCGMAGVELWVGSGAPRRIAIGLFARAFMEHCPQLPVEEDERLHDAALRAAFVEKALAAGRG